jgi:hypothetical protein
VLLAEYNIINMTRKAIKGIVITDHLTDHVVEDYEPLNFDLPDVDMLIVEDGGEMND